VGPLLWSPASPPPLASPVRGQCVPTCHPLPVVRVLCFEPCGLSHPLNSPRWKTRFNREEEARIEAEAKAAFCEHKLHEMGVDPFAQSAAPADDNPSGEPQGVPGVPDARGGAAVSAQDTPQHPAPLSVPGDAGPFAAGAVGAGASPARTPRASSDAFDLIQKQVCRGAACCCGVVRDKTDAVPLGPSALDACVGPGAAVRGGCPFFNHCASSAPDPPVGSECPKPAKGTSPPPATATHPMVHIHTYTLTHTP
jgi:hypothetical protein